MVEYMDMEVIGCGGFADVYKQISTGLVVKKLKDSYLNDESIKSRFKREFKITKSLGDLGGIIKVYEYDEEGSSYTMEMADKTYQNYINGSNIEEVDKVNLIKQILKIMSSVHKREIIHRDLSPNNIFVINGSICIADFGLGKNLNQSTSHMTENTNSFGQRQYCAPEQLDRLKDGDKRSDVYSLSKIINYTMTFDPTNYRHKFQSLVIKAADNNPENRYLDASILLDYFEKNLLHINEQECNSKIKIGVIDPEVSRYLFEINPFELCRILSEKNKTPLKCFVKFIKTSREHQSYFIESIENTYQEYCNGNFEAHDTFSYFAYLILKDNFEFLTKEKAANILFYVAKSVNRFNAQEFIGELLKIGLDPFIKDILEGR